MSIRKFVVFRLELVFHIRVGNTEEIRQSPSFGSTESEDQSRTKMKAMPKFAEPFSSKLDGEITVIVKAAWFFTLKDPITKMDGVIGIRQQNLKSARFALA